MHMLKYPAFTPCRLHTPFLDTPSTRCPRNALIVLSLLIGDISTSKSNHSSLREPAISIFFIFTSCYQTLRTHQQHLSLPITVFCLQYTISDIVRNNTSSLSPSLIADDYSVVQSRRILGKLNPLRYLILPNAI